MHSRKDLIRFDKFNDAWKFKKESEPFINFFSIPKTAIDANPKLQQNPKNQTLNSFINLFVKL